MSDKEHAVVWRQHPTSPKWHAFASSGAASACGLTTKAVGDGQTTVPPWPAACWMCCQALGVKTSGSRPSQPPRREPEAMVVEFIGGSLDGIRVRDLRVIVHDADSFTIVGQGSYTKPRPTITSEVERPATKEPWQA